MRFRIRALVLLVLIAGLILGIVSLTRENHRLRTALAVSQKQTASLRTHMVRGVAFAAFDADGRLALYVTSPSAPESTTTMPNGLAVFADRRP
jgi:hypothetical protein